MTAGIIETGTRQGGYYRYRNWTGNDGPEHENPYQYNIRESYLPACYYSPIKGWDWWIPTTMLMFSPGLPQSAVDHTVNLVNCASNKCFAEIAQSDFKLGAFLGEYKESYHMVCDITHSIASAIMWAKRGNFSRAWRSISLQKGRLDSLDVTKLASDWWMLWHFGISPLLNDLQALTKFLQHQYRKLKYVRRHCVYKDHSTYSLNGVIWQWQLKAVAEVRGEVDMVELSLADRLSLYDVAGVAWELTKLSWMVDWLIPIGNFLEAVNASNKTEGVNFWVTRYQKEDLSRPFNTGMYGIKGFDGSSFETFFQPGGANSRSPSEALPWKMPTIQNPLGDHLQRWYTSFAFLRQSVGR